MAAVQHANLALIYGAETWRATPLLVVEFLEGGTLADRLRAEPLEADAAVELGLVLCDVLDRIHSAGILHRDVKPSNIGYTREGVAKLLDFGLAQMVQDSLYGSERALERGRAFGTRDVIGQNSTLVTEGIVGTPLYMSPEALWGESPSASFDLWSTAIVLYEAIARRSPVQRATWAETLDCITNARVPDVREFEPTCPAALATLLSSSLARERSRRPDSARALAQRLREVRVRESSAAA